MPGCTALVMSGVWLQLVLVAALIVLNAIFAGSELALVSLREGVKLCGPLPKANDLNQDAIIDALSRDKKRDAGQLKWVLLEGIGRPVIVEGKQVSSRLLRVALRNGLDNKRN